MRRRILNAGKVHFFREPLPYLEGEFTSAEDLERHRHFIQSDELNDAHGVVRFRGDVQDALARLHRANSQLQRGAHALAAGSYNTMIQRRGVSRTRTDVQHNRDYRLKLTMWVVGVEGFDER